MKQYVIALDQGTTSSRAILFDREQNIIAMGQKEFPQHYPKAGYVEHDPMEIYSSQYGVMVEVLAKAMSSRRKSRPSASPISARPPSCGIRRPAAPSTMPLSGSAAVLPPCARN